MKIQGRIDDKTQRVQALYWEAETFEEERIFKILAIAIIAGDCLLELTSKGVLKASIKLEEVADDGG